MDRVTQDIVKEKLNDGNGGNAFLFWQLFERLDHIVKDLETVRDNLKCEIEEIKKNILPLQTEYRSKQEMKTTIKNSGKLPAGAELSRFRIVLIDSNCPMFQF